MAAVMRERCRYCGEPVKWMHWSQRFHDVETGERHVCQKYLERCSRDAISRDARRISGRESAVDVAVERPVLRKSWGEYLRDMERERRAHGWANRAKTQCRFCKTEVWFPLTPGPMCDAPTQRTHSCEGYDRLRCNVFDRMEARFKEIDERYPRAKRFPINEEAGL
ncbi:MAG: hypothetical protein NVS1B6_08580 [Steroidobacteraceae bacterium]